MAKSEEQFQSEIQAQSKLANLYKVMIWSSFILGEVGGGGGGVGEKKCWLGLTSNNHT